MWPWKRAKENKGAISITERIATLLWLQMILEYKDFKDFRKIFSTLMTNKVAAGYFFGFHCAGAQIFGPTDRAAQLALIETGYKHIFGNEVAHILFEASLGWQRDREFAIGRQSGGEDFTRFHSEGTPPLGLGSIISLKFDAAMVEAGLDNPERVALSVRQPVTPQYPPATSPDRTVSKREALKHIGLWPDQVFKPRTVDFRLNENDSPEVQIGKVIASGRCPECGHKQLLESPPSEDHIIVACNIPTCEAVFDFNEAIPRASQSRLPAYAALRARLDGRTSEHQPAAPQQKAPPPQPAILKAIPQQPAIPQQKAQARAGGGDGEAIKTFEQNLAAAKARLSTPPRFSGL
jgi:hypothetical protein